MKRLYVVCGVLSLLIVACCVFLMIQPVVFPVEVYEETPAVSATTVPKDHPAPTDDPAATAAPAYEAPAALTEAIAQNDEVYAWIRIPGTNVDYPVVQSRTADNYYLRRGIDGKYSTAGSIMSEHTYNTTTFEDPVTVLYGHCMRVGTMFGKLQTTYSGTEQMKEYDTIEIFLPDKKLTYTVFAAVPYDTRHILYNYDFSDSRIYTMFFDDVFALRSFSAVTLRENKPEYGDKVLILSTCLKGDAASRYLVMAKLNE